LATGSYYAGVPHPPGYPVWTVYSWLFTCLVADRERRLSGVDFFGVRRARWRAAWWR